MIANSDDIDALYRRFGPAVHRRALSLTRDAQEALDVTQETFLSYMKQHDMLRGEASPFTVLYQIATYQSVDRIRHRARWSGALKCLTSPEEEPAEGPPATIERGATGPHQVEAARDLALLTRGEKPDVLTAAWLYHVEGYTVEETALVINLSSKTVSRMLSDFVKRARKRQRRFEPKAPTEV